MRVLHLSPHPDDELLGAPATLLALADAGHEIFNLAVSLGRPADRARREAELTEACARAGFELVVCSPPYAIALGDDRATAQARLTEELVAAIADHDIDLLVSPSPHDGHHGHELVGRAAAAAAAAAPATATPTAGRPPPLWMWGLWSDLPLPTILHPFAQPTLERILTALAAHDSQLGRTDYRRVLIGRAQAAAGLGPERVFGFGTPGISAPYAELLCEAVPAGPRRMLLGTPRLLDPHAPLVAPTTKDLSPWLQSRSPRDRVGR